METLDEEKTTLEVTRRKEVEILEEKKTTFAGLVGGNSEREENHLMS